MASSSALGGLNLPTPGSFCPQYSFAVADGVGRLQMGEYASKIAIQGIEKWWNLQLPKCYGKIEDVIKSLVKRMEKINHDITIYSIKNNCNMATTLSMLLIYKDMYYVLHIGDSRIYHINKTIKQVTIDHKEENQASKQMRLSEYLGGRRKQFDYHFQSGEIQNNDYFIIGSDSVFNRINPIDLTMTVRDLVEEKQTINMSCHQLINKVKLRGEMDNITMIIVNAQRNRR